MNALAEPLHIRGMRDLCSAYGVEIDVLELHDSWHLKASDREVLTIQKPMDYLEVREKLIAWCRPNGCKYEEAGTCKMALCADAVRAAFGKTEYTHPKLFVHPESIGYGREVAMTLGLDYGADPELQIVSEWYIEFNGKRIGSEGR